MRTTVKVALADMLTRVSSWLTTEQVAARLGQRPKYVHAVLIEMSECGDVERRTVGRESEWKSARDRTRC